MTLDQCKKYNKQIGSKIKTLREEQGISQAELAEKSGISTTYLSLLENGKRNNITLSTLYMLGDALHVEISQLLCFCSHSIDEAIDPPNPDDEAEARQLMIHNERILLSFYPDKYYNNKISSLMEFLLYLPLIDKTMLYDALNAFQGHILGNEVYICKRINALIKHIADSPAKQFADDQLNLLHEKRDQHIIDFNIQEGDIDISGYDQYYNLIKNKLSLCPLQSRLDNLQKEINECTKTL